MAVRGGSLAGRGGGPIGEPRADGVRERPDGHERHARDLGFDVGDIRSLLDLANRPDQPCDSVDAIAETHLATIDAKIASLKALRREIGGMLACCKKNRISDCRVIGELGGKVSMRKRGIPSVNVR